MSQDKDETGAAKMTKIYIVIDTNDDLHSEYVRTTKKSRAEAVLAELQKAAITYSNFVLVERELHTSRPLLTFIFYAPEDGLPDWDVCIDPPDSDFSVSELDGEVLIIKAKTLKAAKKLALSEHGVKI